MRACFRVRVRVRVRVGGGRWLPSNPSNYDAKFLERTKLMNNGKQQMTVVYIFLDSSESDVKNNRFNIIRICDTSIHSMCKLMLIRSPSDSRTVIHHNPHTWITD